MKSRESTVPGRASGLAMGILFAGAVVIILAAAAFWIRAGEGAEPPGALASAALADLTAHPHAELADVYKFVYQGSLGPGHYGMSTGEVREYLEQEIAAMRSGSQNDVAETGEWKARPMIEELGAEFVRLNLGPYLAAGGNLDTLVAVVARSAKVPGDSTMLAETWESIGRNLLAQKRVSADSLEKFNRLTAGGNWPAVHHSESYRRWYESHYRVLSRLEWERMRESQGLPVAQRGK